MTPFADRIFSGVCVADEATRIEQAAGALLRWLAQQDAHHGAWQDDRVPVDALAEAIGLDVARFPAALHPGTLGYLEPGEDLIFLRAGLAEPVRRFTLAHELGHAVLHRSDGPAARVAGTWIAHPTERDADEQDEAICGDDDLAAALETTGAEGEVLAAGQAYSARARREAEANAFAAALLLPADRLRRAVVELRATEKKRGARPARNITRRLATHFGVSEDVLLRRLCALLAIPESPVSDDPESTTASANPSPSVAPHSLALDDEQRAAASAETPALIIAGPGSGKTMTLVARVAYLTQERGIPPEKVLALTFSRKAAREMRERLERLLDVSAPRDAHGPLARPAGPTVSTIHAFCGDLLRRYGPLVGLRPDFRLIGEAEGYFLLRRVASSLSLQHYLPLTSPALYFPDLLRAISRAKDSLIEPEDYAATAQAMLDAARTPEDRLAAERAQEVAAVYAAYQRALAARGDADFGDLVRLCVRLLREHDEVLATVRQEYGAVLVDEFQDINRAMGVLLQLLTGEDGALWAVGDADQAIYRFRGASPANLARFRSDYRDAHVHHLSANYRSTPTIIAAADSIAQALLPGEMRLSLHAQRTDSYNQQVTLAVAPDEAAEYAGLVRAITERHQEGRLWRDQAVLCRTRRQARAVVAALQQAEIPTRVAAPLLDQPLVRDVLAVFSLLTDPAGAGLLRAGDLPGHRFNRADARAALAAARDAHLPARALLMGHLDEAQGLSAAGRRGLRALGKALAELRAAPDVATGLARYYFAATGLGFRLMEQAAAGDDEAGVQAAGLSHLITLARLYDDTQRATERGTDDERDDTRTPKTPAADWSGFLEYVRVLLGTPQGRAGVEEESLAGELDAVWVLTVHASKGLEFPVVYVPGLASGRFPAQRQWERVKAPALASDEPTDAAHDEEETCLFYVAITRARDELILSRPEHIGRRSARPSPFLAPIERRLGENLLRLNWPATRASESALSAREPDDGHIGQDAIQPDDTLSVAAIETYARCPRQYAYRYVEGLSANDGNLPRMRRGILEALRLLQGGSAGQEDGADEAEEAEPPTLAHALERFDAVWEVGETSAPESQSEMDTASKEASERPFGDVYRRYGRRIVEQAWQELAGNGNGGNGAGLIEQVGFEETVAIPIGKRTIALTVDRVERPTTPTRATPARYVRDRLGAAPDRPDLRALLYSLAAEQQTTPGAPIEVSQRNMTTGEREPLTIRPRQRENLRDELASAVEGILRSDYTPHPEVHRCQNCPFLLICPA
jgi:superfamily I DNA/RNA helicase/Zn-dependent peptidase ImmA (M78 family)